MRYVIFAAVLLTVVTGCHSAYSTRSPERYTHGSSYYPAEQSGQRSYYSAEQPSQLSYGMVKKFLTPGRTTQAEVLSRFGAPDNMTYQASGEEVWIYDHVMSETSTDTSGQGSELGFSFFGLGNSALAGVRAGAGEYRGSVSTRSSLKTLTVILAFDRHGILRDLAARRGGY